MGSGPVALGAVHRGPSPVPAAPELAEAGPWEHDLARRLAERPDRHPLREGCGHRQGMEKECWPATWPRHLGRRQAASPGPAGPLLSPHNFLRCIFPIKKQLDMNHHVVGGPSGGGGRTMVAKGLGAVCSTDWAVGGAGGAWCIRWVGGHSWKAAKRFCLLSACQPPGLLLAEREPQTLAGSGQANWPEAWGPGLPVVHQRGFEGLPTWPAVPVPSTC